MEVEPDEILKVAMKWEISFGRECERVDPYPPPRDAGRQMEQVIVLDSPIAR